MAHAAEFMADNNKTVALTPNISEPIEEMQPAPEAKFAIKSDKKEQPIATWVWVVVALAGLISGVVLNLVM
jgi:bacteriorhodopsin